MEVPELVPDHLVAITCPLNAKKLKIYFEENGLLDKKRKIQKKQDGSVSIPVYSRVTHGKFADRPDDCQFTICVGEKLNQPSPALSPQEKLAVEMEALLKNYQIDLSEEVKQDLPSSWEIHGDLVLLPENSFRLDVWNVPGVREELWGRVKSALGCRRLAKQSAVSTDGFRTPQVSLLEGDNGWVSHKDNSITYSFDVTKCMFSSGNITEKLRVASFDCNGETVVDLYAGIGYFTLPYLVHTGADFLYACEWNPNAVEALKRNLNINHVNNKCTVLQGDNRKMCPKNVADRVNLGLIPSSEDGWPVACAALKSRTGGVLHIHQNVTSERAFKKDTAENEDSNRHVREELEKDESVGAFATRSHSEDFKYKKKKRTNPFWEKWASETGKTIEELLSSIHGGRWMSKILHIEHVKSYAPHVDHVVLDLECRPAKDGHP